MARIRIALSFEIPEGATRDDCVVYAQEAVATWRGCKRPPGGYGDNDPGDPMFGLDGSTVSASYVTNRKGKRTIVRCEED